jgi:hypothetical protein
MGKKSFVVQINNSNNILLFLGYNVDYFPTPICCVE